MHNFHTIVFTCTIIPSIITHVHEFHDFHQQKINFELNNQDMPKRSKLNGKSMKTPHNPILVPLLQWSKLHVQWLKKWPDNFIFILLLKNNFHNHQPSLDESHTKKKLNCSSIPFVIT